MSNFQVHCPTCGRIAPATREGQGFKLAPHNSPVNGRPCQTTRVSGYPLPETASAPDELPLPSIFRRLVKEDSPTRIFAAA
jgi:hypothetical protein